MLSDSGGAGVECHNHHRFVFRICENVNHLNFKYFGAQSLQGYPLRPISLSVYTSLWSLPSSAQNSIPDVGHLPVRTSW